eukprot:1187921-Prorocentrum_minimum.AAC.8
MVSKRSFSNFLYSRIFGNNKGLTRENEASFLNYAPAHGPGQQSLMGQLCQVWVPFDIRVQSNFLKARLVLHTPRLVLLLRRALFCQRGIMGALLDILIHISHLLQLPVEAGQRVVSNTI